MEGSKGNDVQQRSPMDNALMWHALSSVFSSITNFNVKLQPVCVTDICCISEFKWISWGLPRKFMLPSVHFTFPIHGTLCIMSEVQGKHAHTASASLPYQHCNYHKQSAMRTNLFVSQCISYGDCVCCLFVYYIICFFGSDFKEPKLNTPHVDLCIPWQVVFS